MTGDRNSRAVSDNGDGAGSQFQHLRRKQTMSEIAKKHSYQFRKVWTRGTCTYASENARSQISSPWSRRLPNDQSTPPSSQAMPETSRPRRFSSKGVHGTS